MTCSACTKIRRIDFSEQRYSLVFVGYGASPDDPQVEFWHDWDGGPQLASGERYGHLGIGVRDIADFCRQLQQRGVIVRRQPAAMRPGGRVIALIEDPEGNEVELLAAN